MPSSCLSLGLVVSRSTERAPQRAKACGASIVLPKMRLVDETSLAKISGAGLTQGIARVGLVVELPV